MEFDKNQLLAAIRAAIFPESPDPTPLTDLEKAYKVMDQADGQIESDADFEIVVPSLVDVGMPYDDIITYLKRSPGYDSSVPNRVKSYKRGGGIGIGSLIKWAKDKFNFVPSWSGQGHTRMNLTDYPDQTNQNQNYAAASLMQPRTSGRASGRAEQAQAQKPKKLPPYPAAAEVPNLYGHLDAMAQIKKCLHACYKEGDLIQICTAAAWLEDKKKWRPNGNGVLLSYETIQSCGSLDALQKGAEGISGIGAINPAAGAWVRMNPMKHEAAQSGTDANVADYRYTLIEMDEGTPAEQWGVFLHSRLPIDIVISSGGKSLHAWVRVSATTPEEYEEEVKRLYAALDRRGVKCDEVCKNASRFSRLAGINRGDKCQTLIAVREDLPEQFDTLDEWLDNEDDLIDEYNGYLQPIETPSEEIANEPDHPLIGDGVEIGDKFLFCGDSKAGKSWLLMTLAAQLIKPSGGKWLDMPITPKENGEGWRVFYVNGEIKRNRFHKRIYKLMQDAQSWAYRENLGIINLRDIRGKFAPLEDWQDELIRKVRRFKADILIVDPMYIVADGDENDNEAMRDLMNVFSYIQENTKIQENRKTTFIYVHHNKKGDMSDFIMRNRPSGSGVIGRHYDSHINVCGIDPEHLRAGGIETATQCADGQEKYLLSGLRIEFDLRESAAIAPQHLWRKDCNGEYVRFIKDTTGVLKHAWQYKGKQNFEAHQINEVLTMFDGYAHRADATNSYLTTRAQTSKKAQPFNKSQSFKPAQPVASASPSQYEQPHEDNGGYDNINYDKLPTIAAQVLDAFKDSKKPLSAEEAAELKNIVNRTDTPEEKKSKMKTVRTRICEYLKQNLIYEAVPRKGNTGAKYAIKNNTAS